MNSQYTCIYHEREFEQKVKKKKGQTDVQREENASYRYKRRTQIQKSKNESMKNKDFKKQFLYICKHICIYKYIYKETDSKY